jgi:hypothetical protein
MQRTNPCPLYPNSDRESGHLPRVMSALLPKADMCDAMAHVGLWANSGHRIACAQQK